ncbi:MAG: hypothetical protein ACREQQ_19060 [Candidatus Binatia bacterium]
MRDVVVGMWLALSFGLAASTLGAEKTVVGSSIADEVGKGSINVPVNASLEPKTVAEDVQSNVELTNEAKPDLVEPDTVVEGSVRIDFSNAVPNSTVGAILPEDAARRVMAAAAAGGIGTGAIVGLGAMAVTGGVLGGLAASGEFESGQRPASTAR